VKCRGPRAARGPQPCTRSPDHSPVRILPGYAGRPASDRTSTNTRGCDALFLGLGPIPWAVDMEAVRRANRLAKIATLGSLAPLTATMNGRRRRRRPVHPASTSASASRSKRRTSLTAAFGSCIVRLQHLHAPDQVISRSQAVAFIPQHRAWREVGRRPRLRLSRGRRGCEDPALGGESACSP
jgi:hypothetical protein